MSDYIIGVTGGVASGKSEVTRRFEALGVAVADADLAAREAVAAGSPGLAEVAEAFGMDALTPGGELDRVAMRRRVFDDPAARHRLEAIIHPRVRTRLQQQCERADGPYAIAAIPLLTEGGGRSAYPWIDRVLVVDVPVHVQVERLMRRDGVDLALAESMLAAQAPRPARLAIADDVIVNDGALDALDDEVARLDRLYRELAGAK